MGDPSRGLVPFRGGVTNLNGSYTFHDINRDKQSVTIDMRKPNAAAVALGIIKHADVVIENFTGGTMGRLGASYDFVAEANPRAIMASLTGFGQNGPRGSWPSYHPTSSALSGLTWLFGYEGEGPLGFGHSHMDYMAGYLGALGVLDGLLRREVTGEGDHVDVSQLECGATLVGPQVLQWTVNGETARPEGNRAGALGAPLQGCYQCAGDDQWIAVTAADSETLAKLGELTGAADGSPGVVEAALAAWCSHARTLGRLLPAPGGGCRRRRRLPRPRPGARRAPRGARRGCQAPPSRARRGGDHPVPRRPRRRAPRGATTGLAARRAQRAHPPRRRWE